MLRAERTVEGESLCVVSDLTPACVACIHQLCIIRDWCCMRGSTAVLPTYGFGHWRCQYQALSCDPVPQSTLPG